MVNSTEDESFASRRDNDDESSTADEQEVRKGADVVVKVEEEQTNGVDVDLDVADDEDAWL